MPLKNEREKLIEPYKRSCKTMEERILVQLTKI